MAGSKELDRLRELATLPSGKDVTTIAISIDQQPLEDLPFCLANSVDVGRAFAIYPGKDPADTNGTEFLADVTGQLRAMWYPGLDPDWTDANVLEREIARVREPASASLHKPVSQRHVH